MNPGDAPPRRRLGEILIERGKLDTAALDRALRLQQESGGERLGQLLVTLGLCAQRDVTEALAHQLGLPLVDAAGYPEFPILEEQVSPRFLRECRALPVREDEAELALAMADPTDTYTIGAFEMVTGRSVRPMVAVPTELDTALERLYGAGKSALGQIIGENGERDELAFDADIQQLKDLASEAPVIRMVSLIITNALRGAGLRHPHRAVREPPDRALPHRRRAARDRVAAAPAVGRRDLARQDHGEPRHRRAPAAAGRPHPAARAGQGDRPARVHGADDARRVGRDADPRQGRRRARLRARSASSRTRSRRFLEVLDQPNGILLVTGPTGSGKTTTLYTALARLNQPDVKILTVEDPVEYQIAGINQIQVKPQIGLTFANALRSILRQDPDVIMIGEIRDLETAQIAVQSALTGHLVLSTVHTNDAPSTVNRLLDMGVDDYLLTSTVIGILAQRLVRTLCPACREPHDALPELVEEMGLRKFAPTGQITLWKPRGCPECANTGYTGRVGIVEMLTMSDAVRSLVMRHATAGELRAQALADGMLTMYDDGLRKALKGVTTFEEVLRVTREG